MFVIVLHELLQTETVEPTLGERQDAIGEPNVILQILEALMLYLGRPDGIFPIELLLSGNQQNRRMFCLELWLLLVLLPIGSLVAGSSADAQRTRPAYQCVWDQTPQGVAFS
jgi:hypothetical protein